MDSPRLPNTNFIETTKKLFTFDVSTSIRGLHQKKVETSKVNNFLVVSMKFVLVRLIQPNETFLSHSPRLFTVISEHICFLLLISFSVFTLFSCRFRAVD